jgi:polysaccharide pyruvyl transferase WcaK-like protein
MDRIQVRDKASMRILRSAGVDRTVDVQPDLVFELSVPAAKPNAGRIALVPAPWKNHAGWDQDLAYFCSSLAEKLGQPIDLLPFFPEQDVPLTQKVRAQANCELGLRIWEKPEDLLSWIPEYELVVGMRFHALVLATKAGVAYVGWGNQSKVRQFCVDQSQPYWDFDRGWNADSILRQVTDAWARRALAVNPKPTGSTVLVQSPRTPTTNLLYSTRTN